MSLSESDKKIIINELNSRGATRECSRCGAKKFSILNGYFNSTLQDNFKDGIILGGATIPSIGVVCTNCGCISLHALGTLGLLKTDVSGTNG